jgi:hypothetical protein
MTAARAPFTALAVEPSGERVALSARAGNLVLLDLAAQGYRLPDLIRTIVTSDAFYRISAPPKPDGATQAEADTANGGKS